MLIFETTLLIIDLLDRVRGVGGGGSHGKGAELKTFIHESSSLSRLI